MSDGGSTKRAFGFFIAPFHDAVPVVVEQQHNRWGDENIYMHSCMLRWSENRVHTSKTHDHKEWLLGIGDCSGRVCTCSLHSLETEKRVESDLAWIITRHEIHEIVNWVGGVVAEYTSEVDVDSDTKLLFPESSVIRWPSSFKTGKLLPANKNIRSSRVD